MRYPDGHKAGVRAAIVEKAAKALRKSGLAGVSVADLMKKAGLTHGGFYVHFKNRDELVAAAVLAGAQQTADRVLSKEVGDLRATLHAYLAPEHVAHPELGCVLAGLGSEGRHQSATVRRAFAQVTRGFLRLIEDKLPQPSAAGELSDAALALSSRMVGAIVLARLVDDESLSSRILAAARAA